MTQQQLDEDVIDVVHHYPNPKHGDASCGFPHVDMSFGRTLAEGFVVCDECSADGVVFQWWTDLDEVNRVFGWLRRDSHERAAS